MDGYENKLVCFVLVWFLIVLLNHFLFSPTDALQRIKNEMLADIDASIAAVLPNTLFELKRAHEVGTARLPLVDRTLDWIKTNGT